MNEETSKKTNFFKEALKSIKDLDKYEDFAIEPPKKAFKYFFILVLMFSIIISCFYSYKIVNSLRSIYTNLKDILPEFSYSNGIITDNLEEQLIIEDYENSLGKIIINTKIENAETDEYIENGSVGILILKDRFIILSNDTMGQVVYKYSDLANNYGVTEFNKQDLINFVDNLNIVSIYATVYFAIWIYMFIIYFLSILVDTVILSVLAYVVARISRIKLKFAPSFNIAVHSITLPVLLNLIYIIVNLFTGFEIKYFQLMYSTISYIYVIVSILMIKTDFIQRQMELMKLAQEQEKVKEEMKRKEDEKKEKQKKENKKPEENKKDNKEKKETKPKNKDKGEEGAGANAPACEELGK